MDAQVAEPDAQGTTQPNDRGNAPTLSRRSAGEWRSRLLNPALGGCAIVIFLLIWQAASSFGWVNKLFLPGPVPVFKELGHLLARSSFWVDLGVSGREFLLGLAISVALGFALGVFTGWWEPAEAFFRPIVLGMNSMPQVALIPILILLFGTGALPKIIVVVLSCLPTIILNVSTGVANVDHGLLRMSRSLGATQIHLIRTVVMPSIVPFFMTGIRISVGRAMIAVVVGEFFASKSGLGNLVVSSSNAFNMPLMYATVVVLTVLGILLTQGAGWLERRMQRWKV